MRAYAIHGVWRVFHALWLGAVLALACPPASALDRERSLSQFYHTAWTVKDGAPGQISTLEQTADGYLWIAAAASLYRFDGIRFERFETASPPSLPTGAVSALRALPDGGLWIGFQFGGASFLKDGKLTNYTEREGMPIGTVFDIAIDATGTAWAATARGLVRHAGDKWERIGADWNYPSKDAKAIFADRAGTLWVSTGKEVVFLPANAHAFRETAKKVGGWVLQLTQAPDGTLWAAGSYGAVQAIAAPDGGLPAHASVLQVESAGMLFDHDGAFWVATLGDGIRRIAFPERLGDQPIERFGAAAEIYTHNDGLTADYVWPALEDREGNLWFGTSGGLDLFRHANLVPAEFPAGSHDLAMAAGADGAVWAGTTNRPLMRLKDRMVISRDIEQRIMCAYRAADGQVWLGGRRGIWRIENEEPVLKFPLPEGNTDVDVQAMTHDRSGALWVVLATRGVFRRTNDAWTSIDASRVGATVPLVATTDARGRVWFGSVRSSIAVLDGDTSTLYSRDDGLDLGNVTAIVQGARRIWVGGERGLAYFDGARFHDLGVEGTEPLRGIVGLIEMEDGGLWLHAIPGVIHIDATELERAVSEPAHRMRYELFDFLDGLPARPTQLRPLPTAIRSSDGRLWFATSNGAAWIDPDHVSRNPLPPPVSIRALDVEGKRYPPLPGLVLPQRTTNLLIDYTALSLSIPNRVRFRYRLQDFDADWRDAGMRRQAIYTNLSPGAYRFQVVAANNDGVWNETGAALDFSIAPAYYQTWWFRALCAIAALLLAWMAYLLRLRQIMARVRDRLEQRHLERERIARELHDTLLQSIQGLILRFQAVAEQIPAGDDARLAIESALDRADEVLVEGRDRVRDLRSPGERPDDLPQAFSAVVEKLATAEGATFRVVVEGEPRALEPLVGDEVFWIGREALINAFQHAGAQAIETEIAFEPEALRVRVRDDGVGIGTDILEAGGRPEHWGLPGMRERALKIGAQLKVWGGVGSGTEVEIRVPAKVAYANAGERTWRQLLRRLAGAGR